MKTNFKISRKKVYFLIYFFLSILTVFSLIYILKFFLSRKDALEQSNLLNTIAINQNILLNTSSQDKSISDINNLNNDSTLSSINENKSNQDENIRKECIKPR